MEQEQPIQVVWAVQLYLSVFHAVHSLKIKIINHVVIQTHVLRHQWEDKLDRMVLAKNVPTMRLSSMANAVDLVALNQAILLEMVNVLIARDTLKLVESLVYQKDANKIDTTLVE